MEPTIVKLWLDDVREPPDSSWTWARSYDEAQAWFIEDNEVEAVSLDHDLGAGPTGYDFLKWLLGTGWAGRVILHTMNPVGRKHMAELLE